MQYLSKAYNYYSGINPATLSGAIDVIVVRHVAKDGAVTLSSSPFHVRFGKLQVLRAAEKRVTIRLPNNLPPPHIAPFGMKVGETGEAFFVVETDEEVPEDLLTSPVVMPSQPELPPSPPISDEEMAVNNNLGQSLTNEPFGETEQQVEHDEVLDEVDFLDLDAPAAQSTSKSLLNSASSFIPSIPFISPSSSHSGASTPSRTRVPKSKEADVVSSTNPEPNPMEAAPGESHDLPIHDHKLTDHEQSEASGDQGLPKVEFGEGEGPEVVYGKDVVLDMAGYHSSKGPNVDAASPHDALIETFIQDLLTSVQPSLDRPALPGHRATEPDLHPYDDPDSPDLPSALASVSISKPRPRRSDRGQSEPPEQSPIRSRSPEAPIRAAMDTEWDWANGRKLEMERSASGPIPHIANHRNETSTFTGKLKNVEENPYLFVLEVHDRTHTFELALCDEFMQERATDAEREATFVRHRVTFQSFIEDPSVVNDPRLVIRYDDLYLTWATGYRLLYALAMYRRTLVPPGHTASDQALPSLSDIGVDSTAPIRSSSGYGWSRWWRRGESGDLSTHEPSTPSDLKPEQRPEAPTSGKQYAKTLRLSSDQLAQLHLKPGPNTVQFSVTSSYSGLATCTARIFLWEETDQIVISDIDGTITKSDALGHVFAAIGRDWTHLGIAKLYTDIGNNGYKMLYLTSRAIGQADTTREYLRSITQGNYRLPEGPVIMSPDRLMASLHREVIMRKPELFKMACLRDIQRLFGAQSKEAFYAGFGNRITDAMSYRSVGIEASKIYTIDSAGVVKTELLSAAGHKGSYIQLNDLVNEVFPPVSTKFKPEFTDFNYWRASIPDIPIPDLAPPSPALSARSDTSGRLSVLGKIAGIGRRHSKQPILPTTEPSSRPSSPLIRPSMTPSELSDLDDDQRSQISMPGSFDEEHDHVEDEYFDNTVRDVEAQHEGDSFDDDAIFDDDILAAGEMQHVPF
nr:uncharacterized protein CI109_004977 [Kwoniella shandongensis]KAA5526587.1 hypothetical protein CI109_004977 [Kwoniella shandongensis]